MQENLHTPVTPGMPADMIPDLSTYRAVMDGRAVSLFYALDEIMGGRFDSFLSFLLTSRPFTRVTRADFSEAARSFCGIDIEPLLTDYLDTYLLEQ